MSVDLASVVAYLGAVANAYSEDQIQAALDAETELQGKAVDYPVDENGDRIESAALDNGLKRRVQVNLARMGLQYGMVVGDGQVPARVSGKDIEVRRFEAPYRKARTVLG